MTPVMREKIVAAARSMIGTKFQHQARVPGVGVDCIGLLVCTAQLIGTTPHDFTTYAEEPNPDVLLKHLSLGMKQVRSPDAAGTALLFWVDKIDKKPQHFGIRTPYGFVHAHRTAGQVAEHRFSKFWRQRLVSSWEFKV